MYQNCSLIAGRKHGAQLTAGYTLSRGSVGLLLQELEEAKDAISSCSSLLEGYVALKRIDGVALCNDWQVEVSG